jgi:hypothetical protein
MPLSAICARTNSISGAEAQGYGHLDCTKNLRYLDTETGDYVEDKCECGCHVEKREWYLSDFGPGPHTTLWINNRADGDLPPSNESS